MAAVTATESQHLHLHALGNLARFLVLAGQIDEAAVVAERLKAIPPSLQLERAV